MESVDASDADENERPDQFEEEASQEEESQTEPERNMPLVEDEIHTVEEIEQEATSTEPVHCWKKRLQPQKKVKERLRGTK